MRFANLVFVSITTGFLCLLEEIACSTSTVSSTDITSMSTGSSDMSTDSSTMMSTESSSMMSTDSTTTMSTDGTTTTMSTDSTTTTSTESTTTMSTDSTTTTSTDSTTTMSTDSTTTMSTTTQTTTEATTTMPTEYSCHNHTCDNSGCLASDISNSSITVDNCTTTGQCYISRFSNTTFTVVSAGCDCPDLSSDYGKYCCTGNDCNGNENSIGGSDNGAGTFVAGILSFTIPTLMVSITLMIGQ